MLPGHNIIQETTKLPQPQFRSMYRFDVNDKDGGICAMQRCF